MNNPDPNFYYLTDALLLPPITCLYEELRGVGESVLAALNKSANLSNCPTKAQATTTLNPGF